jgi:hypothetical protein
MTIETHTIYFGKQDPTGTTSQPKDWEPGWDFRIRIVEEEGEIKIEDSCGRVVPMMWQDIHKLQTALNTVTGEIHKSVLGDSYDYNEV